MKQINQFLKGAVDDLALNHVKQDTWLFPTHNIRIHNKRGSGFIITSVIGNEEFFSMDQGYIVISAEEHRGIVYIVSVYDRLSTYTTQIGCYPNPKAWAGTIPDPLLTGFDNVYRPLKNYTTSSYYIMDSSLFGYSPTSNLKMIIDDAFDESVNLYLCDGVNKDKVVNSGFLPNGLMNDIVYREGDFDGKINHILYSLKPVVIDTVSVSVGGELPPGQYHIFFAYKTASYDKTDYFSESFPISVAEGDTATSTRGETDTNAKDVKNLTRKKIELDLSGVDTDYKYLSVAVMRFFSNGEGFTQHEQWEVANDNVIDGATLSIQITGREDKTIIVEDEFYNLNLKERISGDHCFFNSRIWKANLKTTTYDKDLFSSLALLVSVTSFEDSNIPINTYDGIVNQGDTTKLKYQDPDFIYSKLSYFENEVYPFGVTFFLKNGITTDAYPITGWNEDALGVNEKGIFKFARNSSRTAIIGAKFNISTLRSTIDGDPAYSEIVGFNIVRGERIKNMLYDGVLERTANGVRVSKNRKTVKRAGAGVGSNCWYYNREELWFASDDAAEAYHMPVFRYGHNLNNYNYARKAANYYTFPHATYNDNGNDRSDFAVPLPDFLTDLFQITPDNIPTAYEYSIAVENPIEIADNNDTSGAQGDGDYKAVLLDNDAIDTKLSISDTHFALFSPDFMTEIDHLTEDGQEYYMEIYDSYTEQAYTVGTKEHVSLRDDPNDSFAPSSRTRVHELGTSVNTFVTTQTLIIELRMNGAPTVKGTTAMKLQWTESYPVLGVPVPITEPIANAWNIDIDYFAQTSSSATVVDFTTEQFMEHVVLHGGLSYVCIKNTVHDTLAGLDTSPTSTDPSGPWWLLIDSYSSFGQEVGQYEFTSIIPNVPTPVISVAVGDYFVSPTEGPQTYTRAAVTPITPTQELVTIYNVNKGTYKGRGKFSSYAEDGKEFRISGKKGLYSLTGYMNNTSVKEILPGSTAYIGGDLSSPLIHYNRSYQTPAYLGIILPEALGATYSKDTVYMARISKENPATEDFFDDRLTDFNPKYEQYWNISDLIKVNDIAYTDTEKDLFKGDNFKSMAWFRMAHHVDYDDNQEEGHSSRGFRAWFISSGIIDYKFKPQTYLRSNYFLDDSYHHGILYGILTSNRNNVSLRSVLNVVDNDNVELNYSFFPNIAESRDPLGWIYSSSDNSDLVESLNINDGYNQVEGFVKRIGVDTDLPYDSPNRKTAIAFSSRRVVNSYADGYRSMKATDSIDFETNHGEIMRIDELYGMLVTIRERAVFKHIVAQKKITEDLQYDTSAIYLSDQSSPLLYYGLQDWHAFIKTKNAIYAVDVNNNMIYRITMTTTAVDNNKLSPSLMSKAFMIEKKTKELCDLLSDARTTPMKANGISIGYNEEYAEVYFSFLNGEDRQTLVFDEDRDFFLGTSDITAATYIEYNRGILTSLDEDDANVGKVYLSNSDSTSVEFYGQSSECKLSFVVNGNSEQENSVILTKIFESMSIGSPHKTLNRILYETETQKGTYVFTEDSAEFWKDSKWTEGSWLVPIIKENVADTDDYYEEDSNLRGRWLKITLEFDNDLDFSITEIITEFKQSFS